MCVSMVLDRVESHAELDTDTPWCQAVREPCPICDLIEAGPCSACNGHGWISFCDAERDTTLD